VSTSCHLSIIIGFNPASASANHANNPAGQLPIITGAWGGVFVIFSIV
jgi:hypothetical protein